MHGLIILRDEAISDVAKSATQLAADHADIRAAVEEYDIEVDTSVISSVFRIAIRQLYWPIMGRVSAFRNERP